MVLATERLWQARQPTLCFPVDRTTGFVPDHTPKLARSCSLGDLSCKIERLGVRQPHDKGICQRKHYEKDVRGGKGLWHPIIIVLGFSSLSRSASITS